MIETVKKSLYTPKERNNFLSMETKLIFNARNGDVQPLLKLWVDKRSLLLERADMLGLVANKQP